MDKKIASMPKKVYLTGATSKLGREVLRQTKAIPVVREKSGLENEIVSDFSAESLRGIFKDADAVIHLAGSGDFLDRNKTWIEDIDTTRNVVNALPKKAKMIFASSIAVYGKRIAESPADENTPVRPDTPYANAMLKAEKIVARHPNHVILRTGILYGTMFRRYFRILDRVRQSRMLIIGNGDNRIPLVHISDAAKAILNAIKKGQGTYVLVGECLPQKEILALTAKMLKGHPPPGRKLEIQIPKKHVPVWQAKISAYLGLISTRLFKGEPLFIPEDIDVLSSDRAFDCSKAMKELGFRPRKLSEGIFEMVLYMRPVP